MTLYLVLVDMPGKCPGPKASESKAKKARCSITLEAKLEIIRRHEKGEVAVSIAHALNLVQSNVSTALENVKQIKKAAEGAAMLMAKMLIKKRGGIFEEMERLLIAWIN